MGEMYNRFYAPNPSHPSSFTHFVCKWLDYMVDKTIWLFNWWWVWRRRGSCVYSVPSSHANIKPIYIHFLQYTFRQICICCYIKPVSNLPEGSFKKLYSFCPNNYYWGLGSGWVDLKSARNIQWAGEWGEGGFLYGGRRVCSSGWSF